MELDRDGVSIHYEVTGSGPAILLSHGFGASSHMFRPNAAALATDHTLITWDQRGHGRSDSPADPAAYSSALAVADMAAILDAAGAERAVDRRPLARRVPVAGVPPRPSRAGGGAGADRHRARATAATTAGQKWNRMAEGYAADLEQKGLAALGGSGELSASVHRDATGLAHAARRVLTQSDASVVDSLPSIAVPVLVIVGEKDKPFLAGSSYMADKIPDADAGGDRRRRPRPERHPHRRVRRPAAHVPRPLGGIPVTDLQKTYGDVAVALPDRGLRGHGDDPPAAGQLLRHRAHRLDLRRLRAARRRSPAAGPSCSARRASTSAPAPRSIAAPATRPCRAWPAGAGTSTTRPCGCSRARRRSWRRCGAPPSAAGWAWPCRPTSGSGASTTRMTANFARLGFHHGFGLTVTLPAIVGQQRALEMLYTGVRLNGEDAHRIGLLDRLVEPDEIDAAAGRVRHRDRHVGAAGGGQHPRDDAGRPAGQDPGRHRSGEGRAGPAERHRRLRRGRAGHRRAPHPQLRGPLTDRTDAIAPPYRIAA